MTDGQADLLDHWFLKIWYIHALRTAGDLGTYDVYRKEGKTAVHAFGVWRRGSDIFFPLFLFHLHGCRRHHHLSTFFPPKTTMLSPSPLCFPFPFPLLCFCTWLPTSNFPIPLNPPTKIPIPAYFYPSFTPVSYDGMEGDGGYERRGRVRGMAWKTLAVVAVVVGCDGGGGGGGG